MKHILVAYDGSTAAAKAYALGLELASKFGGEVRVLAVARPPEFGSEVETEAVIENSKQHGHRALKPLQAVARSERNSAVHFEVAVGHPAEQIVRHAEEWKADLVVVGHRGRTFFEHWLTGSVAKRVIDHAPCACWWLAELKPTYTPAARSPMGPATRQVQRTMQALRSCLAGPDR